MITVNKIEKMINKSINEFDEISFVQMSFCEISIPYIFVKQGEYFEQLPSSPYRNDGISIKNKKQINSRIQYLHKFGWNFKKLVVDYQGELSVVFAR